MSPVRRYLDSRGYKYSPAVVIYAEIVAISLLALFIAAVAGLWLYGQYQSPDGLSGTEIGLLIASLFSLLNQAAIWRLGAQNKAIGDDVNGNLDRRLEAQNQRINSDAIELHEQHKKEREDDADIR